MGLFSDAGEHFEKAKQSLLGGEPGYACEACDELLEESYDHCPHCGEPAVVELD